MLKIWLSPASIHEKIWRIVTIFGQYLMLIQLHRDPLFTVQGDPFLLPPRDRRVCRVHDRTNTVVGCLPPRWQRSISGVMIPARIVVRKA